jgi:predicted kinase
MQKICKIIPDFFEICPTSYEKIADVLPQNHTCFQAKDGSFVNQAEDVIKELLPEVSNEASDGVQPFILHTAGIPCSGKSYFSQQLMSENKLPQNTVYVQFDEIMEKLKPYQEDTKYLIEELGEDEGIKQAFANWEIPARIIGYELLERAIEKKRHILFDHSASFKGHIELLKNLKDEMGYKIEMHFFDISIEEAKKRVKVREKKTKRYTPESMLFERKKVLNEMIGDYKKIADKFISHKA